MFGIFGKRTQKAQTQNQAHTSKSYMHAIILNRKEKIDLFYRMKEEHMLIPNEDCFRSKSYWIENGMSEEFNYCSVQLKVKLIDSDDHIELHACINDHDFYVADITEHLEEFRDAIDIIDCGLWSGTQLRILDDDFRKENHEQILLRWKK